MVDEQGVIQERLKLLNEYTNDLVELQKVDFPTCVENKLSHRTVGRTLHLAVEACLDSGQQIIAQEGFRIPKDNSVSKKKERNDPLLRKGPTGC